MKYIYWFSFPTHCITTYSVIAHFFLHKCLLIIHSFSYSRYFKLHMSLLSTSNFFGNLLTFIKSSLTNQKQLNSSILNKYRCTASDPFSFTTSFSMVCRKRTSSIKPADNLSTAKSVQYVTTLTNITIFLDIPKESSQTDLFR